MIFPCASRYPPQQQELDLRLQQWLGFFILLKESLAPQEFSFYFCRFTWTASGCEKSGGLLGKNRMRILEGGGNILFEKNEKSPQWGVNHWGHTDSP